MYAEGVVRLGGQERAVTRGDLFIVLSWVRLGMGAESPLDLFRFSDTPTFEAPHQDHVLAEKETE
ncbi:gentisate 1,2-dioxygenase [Lipingzhangella halophila]|uniref:Gentisate 1,2-dioxygenase n=1 Tax=Lipingzhangella halophila TaxID=1783352 RepID=A0A7W7W6R1_9ACTN|nr:hypothetical protein [Lipingzhangella halophila]MBB4935189.1 gentisate 1,2-dioxygenase [Lipingzhangella halophila]